MKKICLLLLLIISIQCIQAKERKVDKTAYSIHYFRDIKYKGYQAEIKYKVKKNYTIGIQFTHAFTQDKLPTYVTNNIYAKDSTSYNVLKIVDIMLGKYIYIDNSGQFLLHISAGPSYERFQNKVNYLPFNCNLIYDTEITQALGFAINSTLHVNADNKFGFDVSVYSNLNTERILLGFGFGFHLGKMMK